jgi:hypothetical protein
MRKKFYVGKCSQNSYPTSTLIFIKFSVKNKSAYISEKSTQIGWYTSKCLLRCVNWQRFWFVCGRCMIRISDGKPITLNEVFHCYPQSLQGIFQILPQVGQYHFIPNSFLITIRIHHCSVTTCLTYYKPINKQANKQNPKSRVFCLSVVY